MEKKKRINTVAKGARLERKAIEIMRQKGFTCLRSAASKGAFDIVCFDKTKVVFIQVKANNKPGKAEMDRIIAIELPENCEKKIFIFKDGKPDEPEVISCGTDAKQICD